MGAEEFDNLGEDEEEISVPGAYRELRQRWKDNALFQRVANQQKA